MGENSLVKSHEGELLNKEQLRQRLNLTSVRCVEMMVKRRKIPVIRMGHRTVRFSWPDVEAALEKLTVRAVE
jgi:excisionase family DNA binding protein